MGGFTGSALFQVIVGAVLNSFRSAGDVETGYFILFILCAIMYLIGLLLFHLLALKMEIVQI